MPGSGIEKANFAVIEAAWGLTKDDFSHVPLGFRAAADALLDGSVDVAFQAASITGTTEEWLPYMPNPVMEKLVNSR